MQRKHGAQQRLPPILVTELTHWLHPLRVNPLNQTYAEFSSQ